MLCGCGAQKSGDESQAQYIKGVWISFSELDSMLMSDFKGEFESAAEYSREQGITDVFVHVIPYCDAIYPSELFPLRASASTQNFDVLEYMISVCHQNGMRLHAWINPYRVRTADSNPEALPDGSPALLWLKGEGEENVLVQNGIYLNPSSVQVRRLIIDGVREIIDGYDIDGIHFDDYFYPSTDQGLDAEAYAEYAAATETPLALDDWRRANINALISGVYTAIKFKDKDIAFSVSPAASIDENFNRHYADVAAWIESGCVDYIIPQLYFGFDYPIEEYRFERLLDDWKALVSGNDTRLLIGLAAYKIGTDSEPDREEWANGKEVIARQAEICLNDKTVAGHIYFSYSAMAK